MNNLSKRLSLHFFFTHPADVSWPDDVGHAADGSTLEQPAKRKQVWIQQIKCLDVTHKKKKKKHIGFDFIEGDCSHFYHQLPSGRH